MTILVSRELKQIRDQLMMTAVAGRSMQPYELRTMALCLDPVIELAELDEQEIQIARLEEAGKTGRSIVERLAGEAMGNMMLEGEAKVVRPDFRRKP